MVCFDSSISVDQHLGMTKSVNPNDPCHKLKQINQSHKNKRFSNSLCDQSPYAVIDIIILIAVIFACCFLFYPYAKILAHKTVELSGGVIDVVIDEIIHAPMVFGCLGLSIFFAAMALVAITVCTDSRCGKSGCLGLRDAAEFDIQLETEEDVKKSACVAAAKNDGLKKGLYEVHHKELEAELKKMAPPNGRAILVFRARCGCCIGKMEVWGARKYRKVKK
ncbi:uncharacterized protein at5g19025 [Phtheirospermum japonicum]|uniref:Uncharacterized protein at5g19025 n=1 Tax=Phtheirospermum japonicum TaxID=374723 RepID=A0A830CQF6_9LAMI|nr:uncharacterized protein at5g19025 [Phtheirospermum japonicum]